MARGGINKALVMKARDSLIAAGENPTIDRVRIELGNTGSKATIHRYLKELSLEESAQLDDETLLSNTLKEMVSKLASRLHEEAKQLVTEAEKRHLALQDEWNSRNQHQNQLLEDAAVRIANLEKALEESDEEKNGAIKREQNANLELGKMQQKLSDLENLLSEKNDYLQSLEDKHQHAREALEHYRQSVKEQREQDQSRHDQQIQQLQSEQRQLSQTIQTKQGDITQLNKDNARLATELAESRKSASIKSQKSIEQENQIKILEKAIAAKNVEVDNTAQALSKSEEAFNQLQSEQSEAEKTIKVLELQVAKLTTELEVKNQVFNRIGIKE